MEFTLEVIALLVVIVGALNWGAVALADMDLVKMVNNPSIEKGIKALVGAAAVFIAYLLFTDKVTISK